jgi:hypothetical protein
MAAVPFTTATSWSDASSSSSSSLPDWVLLDPYVFTRYDIFTFQQGYKNRSVFLKIAENRWNRTGLNLKSVEFIVHCFKILEKDKKSAKYM